MDLALEQGAIHHARASVDALTDVDLIVLATPVPVVIDLIRQIGASGFQGIVTDVASTKREVMAAAASAGLDRFVGGHPMAGRERGGFEHAQSKLFDGRPWFLVAARTPGVDDAGVRTRCPDCSAVERLVAGLGATPVLCDADTHDRTVAYTSHLPQLLAVVLMNAAADECGEAGLAAAGRGFSDMTRLAASPLDLLQGILDSNADFVADAAHALLAHLQPLADPDLRDARTEAFLRAAKSRKRLG